MTPTKSLTVVGPAKQRLILSRRHTQAGGDDAAPTVATAVNTTIPCTDLLKVQVYVYADNTTGAGYSVTLTCWRWFRDVQEDPLGGGATGAWHKGEVKEIPLAYDGADTQKGWTVETNDADSLYFQVTGVAATAALAWCRTDVYAHSSRKDAIAVDVSGVDSAVRSALASFASILSGGEGKTLIDDFESHTTWTANNVATTNKANTASHTWGVRAVTFDKAADGAISVAGITKTLTSTVDLSPSHVGDVIAADVYLADVTNVTYAFIRLGIDGGNYNEWTVPVASLANGWNQLRIRIDAPVAYAGTGWNPNLVAWASVGIQFNAPANALAGIVWDQLFVFTVIESNNPLLVDIRRRLGTIGDTANAAGSESAQLRQIANTLLSIAGGATGKVMLDDFEALAGWAVDNVATTAIALSANHTWGTQSLLFGKAADAAITTAGINKTITAVDLSGYHAGDIIAADIYIPNMLGVNYAFIRLGSAGANYNEWRIPINYLNDGWNQLRVRIDEHAAYAGTGWNPATVAWIDVGLSFVLPATALAGIVWDQLFVFTVPDANDPRSRNGTRVLPGVYGNGYRHYTGAVNATLDFLTDLGRKANGGYLHNNGPDTLTFTINQGSGAGGAITLLRDAVIDLEGLNISSIAIVVGAGGSTYYCTAF